MEGDAKRHDECPRPYTVDGYLQDRTPLISIVGAVCSVINCSKREECAFYDEALNPTSQANQQSR